MSLVCNLYVTFVSPLVVVVAVAVVGIAAVGIEAVGMTAVGIAAVGIMTCTHPEWAWQ